MRYFGTDKAVKEYEEIVQANIKCEIEGDSDEFVSLEIRQDLVRKLLFVTQKQYWEKAVKRFSEYMPGGPRMRKIPLTPSEATALLVEPTEEEKEDAAHLPYRELLGVVNYAYSNTKLEGRYYMSLLARFANGWSARHFKGLVKTLEYGYATREIGIVYSADLDPHGVNRLYAYADSAFTAPRSQGGRITFMNGAAISMTSARHSTTDTSTMAAEITEAYLCSVDVTALRNLMAEVGAFQEEPTMIYQDCSPAVQAANNRGSIAKKSKALDIRVFSLRNRIEDQEVQLKLIGTLEMVADVATKALDLKQFEFCRDVLNGYALVKANASECD